MCEHGAELDICYKIWHHANKSNANVVFPTIYVTFNSAQMCVNSEFAKVDEVHNVIKEHGI